MNEDFQLRLVAAFPPSADGALIRGFREGLLVADSLIEEEPFLNTLIGRDTRGHLRRAAILYRLHELCRFGELPFEATIKKMPRGNWHWLELKSGQFIAHVCRTEGPFAFPEDTVTRQEERFLNQNDLFEPNYVPMAEELERADRLAAWLTFGGDIAGQLQHLCWAVPASDGQDWLAHVNVLRRAAGTGAFEESAPNADKSLRLRFREHVEQEIQRKSSNNDTAS